MRDPSRIERMIGLLRDHWTQHPDLRLGQIVVNAAARALPQVREDLVGRHVYYVEDDRMEDSLRSLVTDDSERCPGCMWRAGDGVNPLCDHPDGCGFFREMHSGGGNTG